MREGTEISLLVREGCLPNIWIRYCFGEIISKYRKHQTFSLLLQGTEWKLSEVYKVHNLTSMKNTLNPNLC